MKEIRLSSFSDGSESEIFDSEIAEIQLEDYASFS